MSYTTVDDVAVSLGRAINPPETDQVQAWINRVESRIKKRIPDLDIQVTDPDFLASLTGVVTDVVIRRINNPEGKKSERIDDYYYDNGSQTADLWPTDSEWSELMPEAASGAFSTRPSFVPDAGARSW